MIKKLWNDESGATAAEYAMILAIIGSIIAIAAIGLSGAIGNAIDDTAECLDDPSSSGPC